jgi:hypothetical protein
MTAIALGLACLGWLLLSLSQRRNFRRVFAEESSFPQRQWPMRIAGYALVLLALWPCVLLLGAPIGICLWLSILALAAFLVIMLLTYRPWLPR